MFIILFWIQLGFWQLLKCTRKWPIFVAFLLLCGRRNGFSEVPRNINQQHSIYFESITVVEEYSHTLYYPTSHAMLTEYKVKISPYSLKGTNYACLLNTRNKHNTEFPYLVLLIIHLSNQKFLLISLHFLLRVYESLKIAKLINSKQ